MEIAIPKYIGLVISISVRCILVFRIQGGWLGLALWELGSPSQTAL
jgi:hypothetical protein